jgi:hypothetical protein
VARDVCNPVTLFNAIIARLIAQLSLNESAVLFSIDPHPKAARSPADLTYVVSPLSGSFDDLMIEGGGTAQCTANTGFTITIHSHLQLDEPQQDKYTALDNSLGLIQAGTLVIKALMRSNAAGGWEPTDASGNILVRDQIAPAGWEFGKENRAHMWMTISFKTVFDWDLT